MHLSQRIQSIPASPTLAITARAKALKAEGVDVLSFGAGEPDFGTPEAICAAAHDAIRAGRTHYTPVGGTAELKAAIRGWYSDRLGIAPEDGEILASCGAKHTLYNIFLALLDPGDEVIIPAPYWVSYPVQVEMAEGKPVFVEGDAENAFLPSVEALDAAVTERTRAIVINNPSNPTGALWEKEGLEAIAGWLRRHPQVVVISDAIYDALVYDGATCHELLALAPELRERYILVNGISKAFAMTGWRLGWAVAPAPFIKAMQSLQSQSTSNPCSITQAAATRALELGEEAIAPMRSLFQGRRDLIADLLRNIPDVKLVQPRGAFYAFPDVSAYLGRRAGDRVLEDDMALAAWLLEEARVAVVPGSAFGAPGFLRLSYATGDDNIRKGVQRIADAFAGLKG